MFDLFWLPNFLKIRHIAILRPNLLKLSRSAISNIIFIIHKLDLLWVPNLIAMVILFIFGTKFPWNEKIYTCFNVECELLSRNYDFHGGYCSLSSGYWWLLLVTGGYLVVTARYLVVTGGYCSLPGGYLVVAACYWWLLLFTARYCLFSHLVWTRMLCSWRWFNDTCSENFVIFAEKCPWWSLTLRKLQYVESQFFWTKCSDKYIS